MNFMRTKNRESALLPAIPLARMREDMDRVFDRFVREPFALVWPTEGREWFPALDVIDGESEVTVRAEVPGMSAKDVSVSMSGNTLFLSGKKEDVKEEKGENFYLNERRFGSFQRSVDLPEGLDADKVNAEQSNGVLTIRIAKSKSAKAKQIPVKNGG